MSRIGRLPISIPSGVEVSIDGQDVTVKGPKGQLALTVAEPIQAKVEDGQVLVTRPDDERDSRSLHGLTRTLVSHERIRRSLACPAGLVFFLFAAHEPLLTVVKKGAYHMIGEASPGAILLCRLGVTLLVAALCAGGYRILERLAPRLLRVLTGNR